MHVIISWSDDYTKTKKFNHTFNHTVEYFTHFLQNLMNDFKICKYKWIPINNNEEAYLLNVFRNNDLQMWGNHECSYKSISFVLHFLQICILLIRLYFCTFFKNPISWYQIVKDRRELKCKHMCTEAKRGKHQQNIHSIRAFENKHIELHLIYSGSLLAKLFDLFPNQLFIHLHLNDSSMFSILVFCYRIL